MLVIRKSFAFALALPALYISLAQARGNPSPGPDVSATAGRSTFNSACAGCHGLDGRGNDKAVNLSAGARAQHLSDAQLARIIVNGVSGTGMPAFRSLTERQIRSVVAYLRSLQGKVRLSNVPGDATRGREIFFGKGDCSGCHTISGEGGFLGPDLTQRGATSSASAMRDQILSASRVPSPGYRTAILTTATGDRLEGLIRNEDNFSVQLQTKDGSFHFLKKAEISSFERVNGSLMPTNYAVRLSDGELDDLVSYLLQAPDSNRAIPPLKNKKDAE